jgi:hypothetical protein
MSTAAQIQANQANSQHSTGPQTGEGKAISSQNHFRHGLTGPFTVLAWENLHDFQALERDLTAEHQPATPTESILVLEMAQSHWLRQRAILLQNTCFVGSTRLDPENEKQLALYIRYGTTHSRAFYKALHELQKLRAEKRKQEIGFVSQERKAAEEKRRETKNVHRQEMHEARLWLTEAQAQRHETEIVIAESRERRASGSKNNESRVAEAA